MISKMENSIILVTGGSGYLGTHLVQALLKKYGDAVIRVLSKSENEIARLIWICKSKRLETILGDIRDKDVLRYSLKNVDSLIHLAAMKHIDLCEMNPSEAITTNVVGTIDLLEVFEGSTFVGMSTDKALEARGCYGATKLLMEKLILERAKYNEDKRYMIVRSGNIFASSGSVIERWRRQIKQGNEIAVTSLEMSRFFIGVDDLSGFIIGVIDTGSNGNIYIPPQKVILLKDLVTAVVAFWGNKDTRVRTIGLRKGERVHEKLFLQDEKVITELSDSSSENIEKMPDEEITNLLRESTKWHFDDV